MSACNSAQGYLSDGVRLVDAQCGKQQPLIPSLTFLRTALLAQKASLIKSARSAATVAIRHLFVYTVCLRTHPSRQIVMRLWGIFSHYAQGRNSSSSSQWIWARLLVFCVTLCEWVTTACFYTAKLLRWLGLKNALFKCVLYITISHRKCSS